jgi:hypothetical protein
LNYKASRTGGPELFKLSERYRGQWIPHLAMLCVEGRPGGDTLCRAADLPAAYAEVCDLLGESVGSYDFLGIARLDAAVTYRFGTVSECQAFFSGLAALDFPRTQPNLRGNPPHSLSWSHPQGRRILARAYDKGYEQGGARCLLARLEDQGRFGHGKRPGVDALEPSYVRGRFERRFAPLRRAARGVTVAGLPVIAEELAARIESGELTFPRAARLCGTLMLQNAGGKGSRRTMSRHRAELRAEGYVLADDYFKPVNVDLGALIEQALESPLW